MRMTKHFRRRMSTWQRGIGRELVARIPAIRRYGLWAIVAAIIVMFINVTRDQIVWNTLVWIWGYLQIASEWIVNFAFRHGTVTVVILLCLWIGALVTHAYFDTLPPRDISFQPTEPRHDGDGSWSGFVVENRSGEDLVRVWITDKKSKLKLQWGRSDPSQEYHDILHGKEVLMEWIYFNHATKQSTIRKVQHHVIPAGRSEIELEFGATPRGQSPYIKPLYVTVEVSDTGAKIISADW